VLVGIEPFTRFPSILVEGSFHPYVLGRLILPPLASVAGATTWWR